MAEELAKAARGETMDIRRVHVAGRSGSPERVAAARIPIERYAGPLLVAGGGRDTIWPSAEMTQTIASTRHSAQRPTTVLIFPGAGHALAGPGTEPVEDMLGSGDAPAALAHARAQAWQATLKLFDAALLAKAVKR